MIPHGALLYIGFVLTIFKYRISLIQLPYEVGLGDGSLFIRRLELRRFEGFGVGHTVRVRSQCRSQMFVVHNHKAIPMPVSQVGGIHRPTRTCVLPMAQCRLCPTSGCVADRVH